MPVDSSLAGTTIGPVESYVDARWTMAYAASLDDFWPCYIDTRRRGGIVAHPIFPVCFEWPLATELNARVRAAGLTAAEAARGVHATYDVITYRAIRPPETLATTVTMAGIERRKPGAFLLMRFDTRDQRGEMVCTTWYGQIFRAVEIVGADRPASDLPAAVPMPAPDDGGPVGDIPVAVSAAAAHLYTECARIWNPIHTDAAVAERAGLPAIILHGTATVAMAASKIIVAEAGYDPTRVRRVAGRFAAMVLMPSMLTLRIIARDSSGTTKRVFFEALTAEGKQAIRDGLIELS
ncbi:MAG TPA: MaoC/PaaZ C-terminal domain-containing protein [Candidatus Binataceae bacterium]|nr:MaoC/PaaZ C-terminal domain-containing protein [Candidatus Binataceae bacterium]